MNVAGKDRSSYVFPQGDGKKDVRSGGLTLRDYFAGCALIGVIASSKTFTEDDTARFAYAYADAMLMEK